jgi:hypothetical protein
MRRNRDAVQSLKPYLGNVETDPGEKDRYGAALHSAALGRPYTQLSFHAFTENEQYAYWKAVDRSGLLILKGKTLDEQTGFSWLSPAPLNFLDQVRNEASYATIYCLVGTSAWMQPGSEPPAHAVVSKMIWQLLERKPDLVGNPDRLGDVRNRIQMQSWRHPIPKEPCGLLLEMLSAVPKAYIVIDRIDRADCDPVAFINELLRVIERCPTIVKIFVVLGESFDSGFDMGALDLTGVGDKCFVVTMDQELRRPSA